MGNTDKYKVYQLYKSSDGINWSPRDEYKAVLLEEKSTDCGYSARTITTTDDDCSGTTKITTTTILNQESEDFGETWTTVSSSSTKTYEYDSEDCGYVPKDYSQEYLTFIVLSDGYFRWSGNKRADENATNKIQYSTDGGYSWSEYSWSDPNGWDNRINVKTGDVIKWKGEMLPGYASGVGQFIGSVLYNIEGNIMSLLYGDDFQNKTSLSGKKRCFMDMFYGRPVVNANNLVLPATTLDSMCYYRMFENCKNLITAPELPATTLAGGCYEFMFQGCTSLIQAPSVLQATTLSNTCYRQMFVGCTSLKKAPEIKGTIFSYKCCESMFNSCTSLIQAPSVLSATTLDEDCCWSMFRGCTSLTTAPQLPATTLAEGCYGSMFWDCTSLTTAPQLPATTLAESCYSGMFAGCTSLTTAPQLPATTLANKCYQGMFQYCTSLTRAPELPATTLADSCYKIMFVGSENLNYIKMLATDISADSCLYAWVQGVANSGTFVKKANTTIKSGVSGIPSGWTVQNV